MALTIIRSKPARLPLPGLRSKNTVPALLLTVRFSIPQAREKALALVSLLSRKESNMSAQYAESATYATGAPSRTVQVTDQLNSLQKFIEEGEKIQAEMENRLSPVLRAEPELIAAEGGSAKDKEAIAPLAERISGLASGIRRVNARYNQMMRRLDAR